METAALTPDLPHDEETALDCDGKRRRRFSEEQVAEHAGMTLAALQERYGCSKATASRLKNGQDFVFHHYREREVVPSERREIAYAEEIAESARRAVRNVVRTLMRQHGYREQDRFVEDCVAPATLDEMLLFVRARLRELAGCEEFLHANWRNQAAYFAARRLLERQTRARLAALAAQTDPFPAHDA